ncbi:MAG TPA: hypothetical protein VGN12_07250 [Pirellulales bacterium]|jgi:hypothetical protein
MTFAKKSHTLTKSGHSLPAWSLLIAVAIIVSQGLFVASASAALSRLRAASAAAAAGPSCGAPACAAQTCATPVKPCCPEPCIRYIDRTCGKTCCDSCKPAVKTVLKVVNPVTCCPVDVPVCLPACCEGCPAVDSKCGLLSRGVVTYDWCCGYRVVVRFDRCGDVTVVYRG